MMASNEPKKKKANNLNPVNTVLFPNAGPLFTKERNLKDDRSSHCKKLEELQLLNPLDGESWLIQYDCVGLIQEQAKTKAWRTASEQKQHLIRQRIKRSIFQKKISSLRGLICRLLLVRFRPAPLSCSPSEGRTRQRREYEHGAKALQTKQSEVLTRQLGRGRNSSTWARGRTRHGFKH